MKEASSAADSDRRFLRRTLELAARGRTTTSPNPRVGCVITARHGEPGQGVSQQVIGEGWHRRAGQPHAEIEALQAARAAGHGEMLRGATLYVNLEPCSHRGRTPPCAEAVIEAGIGRVVACQQDPNPAVAGHGFELLRRAGIEVEVGQLALDAVELNLPFLTSQLQHRPAVTLKWAMSLDGRIATVSGESQWISSPEGRQWALDLRLEHDAILVGSGTVLADDPRLNRRGKAPNGAPIVRIVMDRRLRTPPQARMLDIEGPVVVYTEVANEATELRQLVDAGRTAVADLTVVSLPRVTPAAVLADLHQRDAAGQVRQGGADPLRSLLIEGGGEVTAAFVRQAFFDRVEVCCAPRLISGRRAPGPVGGDGISQLELTPHLEPLHATRRGVDLILSSYRKGCLEALRAQCLPASS